MSDPTIRATLGVARERRQLRWETDQGPVLITFPAELTLPELDDLEAVINLQMAVLRRVAARAPAVERAAGEGGGDA